MKKLFLAGLFILCSQIVFSQGAWRLTGNIGLTANEFLGSIDNKDIVFKTFSIERGRLLGAGSWRLGTAANNATIDVSGNLFFNGAGSYLVAGNSYVFRYATTPNYGLFFNSTTPKFEFRNGSGIDVFAVDADNGDLHLGGQKFISAPGINNISIGYGALNPGNTGNGIIALGEEALMSNTTGEWNTAIGYQALVSNTNGNYNNSVGYHALRYNTTGHNNDAYGTQALMNNATGGANTAIGTIALWQNTTGSHNVAIGVSALGNNTTAPGNTAVGRNAMGSNIDGWQNTSIGYESLLLNTTGTRNCVIGAGTFANNVSGGINIGIGVQADVTAPDLVNAIAIGTTALVDASDKVRIGNTNITSIGGEVSWTTFSDARYKRNIKEDVPGLTFINSLRPITYTVDINALNRHYPKNKQPETEAMRNSKIKEQNLEENAAMQKLNTKIKHSEAEATKIVYTGFAAQEVEAVAQRLNYNFSGIDKPKSKDGLYGLRYSDFVIPLVKAVQEISKKVEEKDEKIAELTSRIEKLEQLISGITKGGGQNAVIGNEALLEQNAPNPFTNGTTIRYQLPGKFSSAHILVTDKSGKALKQISLAGPGKGKLNIDSSTLAVGAYQYSLYVDGKLIETKQMILVR